MDERVRSFRSRLGRGRFAIFRTLVRASFQRYRKVTRRTITIESVDIRIVLATESGPFVVLTFDNRSFGRRKTSKLDVLR